MTPQVTGRNRVEIDMNRSIYKKEKFHLIERFQDRRMITFHDNMSYAPNGQIFKKTVNLFGQRRINIEAVDLQRARSPYICGRDWLGRS